jgi:Bacterial Ig domain
MASSAASTSATNEAPAVSISVPLSGAVYTAPASFQISALASDSDGTITKVEFYRDTTLLFTDTAAPYNYSWGNVAAGGYSLTVKATDNAGAFTTSQAVSITVNPNTAPTVSLTSPADGSSFNVPADVILAATASDSDGSITKVEFFSNGVFVVRDTTAPYSMKWHAPAGNHEITAKATDNGGAVTTSSSVNIIVVAMTVPPESLLCPNTSSSTDYLQTFSSLGQTINIPINLAPCETVAVNWVHQNPQNPNSRGTTLQFNYYNYKGESLASKSYNGIGTTSNIFPNGTVEPNPWRGTVGLEGLPVYLVVESTNTLGFGSATFPPDFQARPPEYKITVARESRPGYNLGGRTFDTALDINSFPSSFFGSLRPEDRGQFFKVRLQGGESLYLNGYAEGSVTHSGKYLVDIFDASRQLRWLGFWGADNDLNCTLD